MFICSVKGNTLKLFAIITIALVAVTALVIALPGGRTVSAGSIIEKGEKINYDKIKTPEDRLEFLSQFGWECKENCTEDVEVQIPENFDKVMNAYNDIQKSQGFDLSKYKGKTVRRYTYEITNYPDYDGTVFANIIVYKNRVIGGDVCSADIKGFITGLEMEKLSSDTEKP